MMPAKSFGILIKVYRGLGVGIAVNPAWIKCQDWDTTGMGSAKPFGILIEGYRGGAMQIGDRRDREIR